MIRRLFTALFRLVLRIFFGRIEIAGLEHVPPQGPVMFVLNHPNALIDPGLMLCLAPRRVSFLAKSTLFSMPVVSAIVKGFDSLPVYRRSDEGVDPSKNRQTFEQARNLLARGGSLAIFPEGTSHSDPTMRRLKTGAARLALGAAALQSPQAPRFRIVPAGLYYTRKTTFRSAALVQYAAPIEVDPVELDAEFEPPPEAVRALTDRIRDALEDVTLQAEHGEVLQLIERAEAILSAADEDGTGSLSAEFGLKRRLLAGYRALKTHHPGRLEAVTRRMSKYESRVRALGLDVEHLSPEDFSPGSVTSYALRSLLFTVVLGPLAIVGTVTHYPAYLLVDCIAGRLSRGVDDMLATIKVLSAMLFFLLTWVAIGAALFLLLPWWWALGLTPIAPLTGYAALLFQERFDRAIDAARGLWVFLTRRQELDRLHREREAIRREVVGLGELTGVAGDPV
ncbi:MAG: 1-acyl-sn-glycerol-3-phosphate acyltransferase [Deltaproteobacteria bacterium]|nr:1-acyl-sn-glycerol-3-phosphate acyltransferase [Deltaproteobacteria bacterium]